MADSLIELESWFKDRPVWMQNALKLIVHNGQIGKDDLKELVTQCKAEAGIYETAPQTSTPKEPIHVSLDVAPTQHNIRLRAIFDLKGINALSPRNPLEFNDGPLTLIYGQNASGKSGYIRVLKHCSGQRKPGALLKDVFSKTNETQSCKFKFAINGAEKEAQWQLSTGPVDELRALQVYDSNSASLYINEENETAYEPFALSLFSQLTEICGTLNSALEAEIRSKPSKKPAMPSNC